jgi:hypothetical protein
MSLESGDTSLCGSIRCCRNLSGGLRFPLLALGLRIDKTLRVLYCLALVVADKSAA